MWATTQRGTSRGNPASGQMVEFFVNDEKRETKQAEQDGRTFRQKVMVPSGVLSVNIEAQKEGDATTRSPKIVRWEGKPPQPKNIEHYTRKTGEVCLMVFRVLDDSNNPVSGETVVIKDKDDERLVYPLDTPSDKNGLVRCSVPMAEEKDIVVMSRGVTKSIRLVP